MIVFPATWASSLSGTKDKATGSHLLPVRQKIMHQLMRCAISLWFASSEVSRLFLAYAYNASAVRRGPRIDEVLWTDTDDYAYHRHGDEEDRSPYHYDYEDAPSQISQMAFMEEDKKKDRKQRKKRRAKKDRKKRKSRKKRKAASSSRRQERKKQREPNRNGRDKNYKKNSTMRDEGIEKRRLVQKQSESELVAKEPHHASTDSSPPVASDGPAALSANVSHASQPLQQEEEPSQRDEHERARANFNMERNANPRRTANELGEDGPKNATQSGTERVGVDRKQPLVAAREESLNSTGNTPSNATGVISEHDPATPRGGGKDSHRGLASGGREDDAADPEGDEGTKGAIAEHVGVANSTSASGALAADRFVGSSFVEETRTSKSITHLSRAVRKLVGRGTTAKTNGVVDGRVEHAVERFLTIFESDATVPDGPGRIEMATGFLRDDQNAKKLLTKIETKEEFLSELWRKLELRARKGGQPLQQLAVEVDRSSEREAIMQLAVLALGLRSRIDAEVRVLLGKAESVFWIATASEKPNGHNYYTAQQRTDQDEAMALVEEMRQQVRSKRYLADFPVVAHITATAGEYRWRWKISRDHLDTAAGKDKSAIVSLATMIGNLAMAWAGAITLPPQINYLEAMSHFRQVRLLHHDYEDTQHGPQSHNWAWASRKDTIRKRQVRDCRVEPGRLEWLTGIAQGRVGFNGDFECLAALVSFGMAVDLATSDPDYLQSLSELYAVVATTQTMSEGDSSIDDLLRGLWRAPLQTQVLAEQKEKQQRRGKSKGKGTTTDNDKAEHDMSHLASVPRQRVDIAVAALPESHQNQITEQGVEVIEAIRAPTSSASSTTTGDADGTKAKGALAVLFRQRPHLLARAVWVTSYGAAGNWRNFFYCGQYSPVRVIADEGESCLFRPDSLHTARASASGELRSWLTGQLSTVYRHAGVLPTSEIEGDTPHFTPVFLLQALEYHHSEKLAAGVLQDLENDFEDRLWRYYISPEDIKKRIEEIAHDEDAWFDKEVLGDLKSKDEKVSRTESREDALGLRLMWPGKEEKNSRITTPDGIFVVRQGNYLDLCYVKEAQETVNRHLLGLVDDAHAELLVLQLRRLEEHGSRKKRSELVGDVVEFAKPMLLRIDRVHSWQTSQSRAATTTTKVTKTSNLFGADSRLQRKQHLTEAMWRRVLLSLGAAALYTEGLFQFVFRSQHFFFREVLDANGRLVVMSLANASSEGEKKAFLKAYHNSLEFRSEAETWQEDNRRDRIERYVTKRGFREATCNYPE
ncbi:unnamed protein product [Amoebophrya sp. A120]|nr:unnamed protein product [Amoebophrya sp. A120]|eukprot:GSA120T00015553001.1